MTDRLERLVNLVIALRETRVPLTAADVHERVAGYGQSDHEAFRRMFERDKADLRALGVPIETAPLDAFGDRVGYSIDPSRYDLPELAFEPHELAALAVAVEATGLREQAEGGLRKLAIDVDVDPGAERRAAAATVPHVEGRLDAPNLTAFMEARVSRSVVRFRYAAPGRPPANRTVEPHALVHRHGRWYLVGFDRDRRQRRHFRLDRVDGGVRTLGEPGAFDVPDVQVDPADVVPSHDGDRTATVVADADVAWQVARRARGAGRARDDGRSAYEVPVGDEERFVSWVLGWGPAVVVEDPPELRATIVARLRALAGEATR